MALEEHQIQQQRQAQTGNTQDHGETRATGNNRGQRDSTITQHTTRNNGGQRDSTSRTTGDHGGPRDFKRVKMTKPFSLNKNPHSTVFNVETTKRTAKLRRIFWSLDAYCFRNSFLRKSTFRMLIFEIFIFTSIYPSESI